MNPPVTRSDSSPSLVTVCLLAYNHARILRRAVESVLAQDYGDFEFIISDDCSTDDCWELVRTLAREDRRIRPVRTPHNLGMAKNANFAVGQAHTRYVALLHHDDICAPNLLRSWLAVAERHPTVAFVSNAYAFADARVEYHSFNERTDGREALERIIFPTWGCPIRGTALIRKSCWDAVAGMRERFGMLADVDLWMRLAGRWDIGYVRDPLITVLHEPPADYPTDYVGWSWPRTRLLYDIHGTNRHEYFASRPVKHLMETLKFRWRVSAHELYWLAYAVAKPRADMLATSELVENSYEFPFARLARKGLAAAARSFAPRSKTEPPRSTPAPDAIEMPEPYSTEILTDSD